MVQFFQGLPSQKGILSETLGKGLANFTTSYFADKSLQKVVNDPNLKKASLSERYNALESALRPYGEQGQNILQSRLQSELRREQEQELKKQETRQRTVGPIFGKIARGEDITPEEESMLTPQELKDVHTVRAAYERANKPKAPLASEQPITPEQLKLMQQVRNEPGFDELNEVEQYRKYIDSGVSPINAERESKLKSGLSERQQKEIEKSYENEKEFIDNITNQYKSFEMDTKPRLLQMQSLNPEKLISPTGAVFLDSLGIPLGALQDPSSEVYQKLSQDLLKGLPETYGNRILKVEVDNFLKTIPTLMNSVEGRRMITSNLLKLGEMKEAYYNAMRQQQRSYLDQNKKLPRDFQQNIWEQVKPQIDRINNDFMKMAQITHIPPNTIPFFSPQGEIHFVDNSPQAIEWATKNGGRKIW